MRYFILSILLFGMLNNITAGAFYPGKPIGVAQAEVKARIFKLENNTFTATWKISNKRILFDADIIVSGGRGTTTDSLGLIKALAEALKGQGINAEWACSRPVVDEGITEYARQVGQTGKTVRPKVYVAVGISGAIQHIAGMKEAGTVIAINQNPKASIFNNADFGIIGNYQDIIPELMERVKGGFTFGIEPKK